MTSHSPGHDPLRPHAHEPNPSPPSHDPSMRLVLPSGKAYTYTLDELRALPAIILPDCLIVSTGHGTSGPFAFGGARLADLVAGALAPGSTWSHVAVYSADGFGTRIFASELLGHHPRPILLAYRLDDRPLSRDEGLVRLIVPSETDDALRQVKWVAQIVVG